MNSKKEHPKQQHCPGCNRYVKHSSRYPNYACSKCVSKDVDVDGRAISFFNTTEYAHGCQGMLVEKKEVVRSKICFIKGIRFKAEEAYLEGVILIHNRKKS